MSKLGTSMLYSLVMSEQISKLRCCVSTFSWKADRKASLTQRISTRRHSGPDDAVEEACLQLEAIRPWNLCRLYPKAVTSLAPRDLPEKVSLSRRLKLLLVVKLWRLCSCCHTF